MNCNKRFSKLSGMIFSTTRKLEHVGLFHIFGSNIFNRLISFLTVSAVAHILSKEQYGIFESANNIFNLFVIINGFGMVNAMLLYCSEEREKTEKSAIYQYTFICGFLASVLLSLGMLIYGLCGKVGIRESAKYIVLLSALPVLDYSQQYILTFFRTRRENKAYARLLTLNACAHFTFDFLGALLQGVSGLIVGRYLMYGVTIIASCIASANFRKNLQKIFITASLKRALWNYSLKTGITSALNQIVYLIDIALIGFLISDATVLAGYKVATVIPEALNVVPQSVIITFLPYFSAQKSKEWIAKSCKKLFHCMAVLNFTISLILYEGAPIFLKILGGEKYLDGIRCFRTLAISYFFLATFRLFSTNLLAIFHKVSFNLLVSIFTGVCNISLDYFLIQRYGAIGAALATLITVLLASFCSFPYLIHVVKNRQFGD